MSKQEKLLSNAIDRLLAVDDGERNMYPYLWDLLSHRDLGVALSADQLVIDTSLGGKSGAPDIAVYNTSNGKAIKSPDHLVAGYDFTPRHGRSPSAARPGQCGERDCTHAPP